MSSAVRVKRRRHRCGSRGPRTKEAHVIKAFLRPRVARSPRGRSPSPSPTTQVVGFAGISGDELTHLYVDLTDQKRGVGSSLLEHVKGLRPKRLELWVFQKNEGARRFYERHGFRLVRLTDGAGNMEQEPDALYEWAPSHCEPG